MKTKAPVFARPTQTLLTGCVLALCIVSCRPDHWLPKSAPWSSTPSTSDAPEWPSADTASPAMAVSPDTVLPLVRSLQDDIYASPKDTGWITPLLTASYDSACGCFYVVGKGVANPDQPPEAARPGQIRAAETDAKRWALYLKAWHTGDRRAFGADIAGEVSYTRSLLEKAEGDTLVVLLQVPVGSVTVQ